MAFANAFQKVSRITFERGRMNEVVAAGPPTRFVLRLLPRSIVREEDLSIKSNKKINRTSFSLLLEVNVGVKEM